MKSILVFLALLLAKVVVSKDIEYLQDFSHRSVFPNTNAVTEAWPVLPFSLTKDIPKKGGVVAMGNCILALSGSSIFGASEVSPATDMSMENPYNAWDLVSDLGTEMLVMSHIQTSKNGTELFALTADNIARIHISAPDAQYQCGKVQNIAFLLTSDLQQDWGSGLMMQYAPSLDVLFIGSANKGVQIVHLSDGAVSELTHVATAGQSSTAMLWVDKWATLYTSNNLALYTLKYSTKERKIVEEDHEWIGGNIGTTPTDMDYDSVNNVIWVAESECIHRITQQSMYWRFGWQQGAPMLNISTVAAHNGIVYSGSWNLGMARLNGAQSPEQLDLSANTDNYSVQGPDYDGAGGDPWSWSYYYGPRYLPSNDIQALVATSQQNRKSVLAVTGQGLALLDVGVMTLAKKAVLLETFQNPRHDRHGLSTSVHLNKVGVLSSYQKEVGDNDGLWTGMSAMGAAYRYLVNKEPEARALAWRMFEGMELLSISAGGYPSFVARSFSKLSDGDGGLPPSLDPACTDDCWYESPTLEGWWYKGDTSSDELCGHMAAYPVLYDAIAENDEEKARILKLYDGIIGGIVDNDLYLIQPATGKRTLWGFWNPKEINHEPEHYSERGLNSIQILGWLTGAYSVTGKEKYREQYWVLVNEHKYVLNTLNAKIDSSVDENHSDTELIMLAYQALFYAYERLPDGHERKAAVWDMVSPMVPSIQRTFLLLKGELSPLWLGIYAGTAKQTKHVNKKDVDNVQWWMRHYALDLIEWPIYNSQRIDLDISDSFHVRNTDPAHNPYFPLMKNIRPPNERAQVEWNADPFAVNPGGSGSSEFEPGVYLFPYYLTLYHGLV